MSQFTVVGGGAAGLVIARRLAKAHHQVTLLEASDRLGGTLSSHIVDGFELDAGPESFAVRGGIVEKLLGEIGLRGAIVSPEPVSAWLMRSTGGAVPLPATAVLGIPGQPLASDVIAVVGMRTALRAQLDALIPSLTAKKKPTGSLGRLVRRRMGKGMLEKLVAPVVHGVHSMHPDDISIDRAAPGLAESFAVEGSLAAAVRSMKSKSAAAGSAVQGIEGGIARLGVELAADMDTFGVTVELGRRVESLDDLPGTVIVAAPGLLGQAGGREIHLVTLVVDAPALDANPRGSGLLVAAGAPGIRARALTHATAKWAWLRERLRGNHVVRLSYDTAHPDMVETARADAAALLGVDLPPSAVQGSAVVTWVRPEPVDPADHPQYVLVGEQVAGSGLAGVIRQAEETAERLIAELAAAE